jgi:regulator of replication initiation timing
VTVSKPAYLLYRKIDELEGQLKAARAEIETLKKDVERKGEINRKLANKNSDLSDGLRPFTDIEAKEACRFHRHHDKLDGPADHLAERYWLMACDWATKCRKKP